MPTRRAVRPAAAPLPVQTPATGGQHEQAQRVAAASFARALMDSSIRERDWQHLVIGAAETFGWLVYHTHYAIRSVAGFPDLCCVHRERGRLLFAELKTQKGKVSGAQQMWLSALGSVPGVETFVWKPGDWDDVQRILEGK